MGRDDKDRDDLARELATTPPVKQLDNLGAAVETAEKNKRPAEEPAEPPAERKDGANKDRTGGGAP